MTIANVISLLGGIALFLYGMADMGESLKRVAGSKLEVVLYKLSSTPLKSVLLGTGVTAVIQSSSATSVMVVGFVNSEMMKLKQAVGVILGSFLGTSITGWILCLNEVNGSGVASIFSSSTITAIFAVTGILMRMTAKGNNTQKYAGTIMLGFAVLMFGMSAMSSAVAPLKESEAFCNLLILFSNPFLGILAGIVITSIVQSASAAVGILQALSITGVISYKVAIPVIIGMAIGASTPVLLSALGANINGKRSAFAYLLISITGAVTVGGIYYICNAIFPFTFQDTIVYSIQIALLNTIFRALVVITQAPFIPLMVKILKKLFPSKQSENEKSGDMDRLEERFLKYPALAIEQSRLVINSMAANAKQNLDDAMALRFDYSAGGYQNVEALEGIVDRYEDKLGTYLMRITNKALKPDQSKDVNKYLRTISDFERISDHALNIANCAREIHEKKIVFSEEGNRELEILEGAVKRIVIASTESFIKNDLERATHVEPLEEVIDDLCDAMKTHHVERLQAGDCFYSQGFVFNDLLTNYERIADHCSNIAVSIIEMNSNDFDTHQYLASVREARDESFKKYLQMYQEMFQI